MSFDRIPSDELYTEPNDDHPRRAVHNGPMAVACDANPLPTRIDTRTVVTGAIALSVDQASRLSNLSTATIYRALASGHLKRRKYGHRTLIMFADLEAFLEGLAGER
jgi:excisionase family DNA binding protein